jgi:ABC-2 type transport system permease protein
VLARLATLPISRAGLLAGRIIGLLGLALVQGAIMLIFGRLAFDDVHWGPDPLALLVLLACLGLAAAALGIFLGAVLRTPEQASAIAWIVPLFLGAIGGCWWPLEVTPEWMQAAGHISPAAWAMDGMHGMISFGKGASAIFIPCLILLGYAVVLTAIGSRLLRTSD